MNVGSGTALQHIFTPLAINNLVLRNRVVSTSHQTNFTPGMIGDAAIAYHAERARGGVGLIILEGGIVHPNSAFSLNIWDDSVIGPYQRLAQELHRHGARVFQQLNHAGFLIAPPDGGLPWGASPVPSPRSGIVPQEMTLQQIDELIAHFASAARRCVAGGLDGVELLAANSYLLQQFLSPITNQRTDRYGGDIGGRSRLLAEVAEAVRSEIGVDFVMGVRIGAEATPGGLSSEEAGVAVAALKDRGLIDYVSVSTGGYWAPGFPNGRSFEKPGYQLPFAHAILAAADGLPRLVVGRFQDLADADAVIAQGHADLVGLTRAQIADPEIVHKTQNGRVEDVRPCLFCNQGCIGGFFTEGRLRCVVNAAVGEEMTSSERTLVRVSNPKRILVIGGGPAGMEAARIAAIRGHQVTLAERTARIGGKMAIAGMVEGQEPMASYVAWQERQLRGLHVDLRLNTNIDSDSVGAIDPDSIVVATGAVSRADGFQMGRPGSPGLGFDRSHVFTSAQAIIGPLPRGARTAVVLDDVGDREALTVATSLLTKGIAVTLVTRFPDPCPLLISTNGRDEEVAHLFEIGDFTIRTREQILEICRSSIRVINLYSSMESLIPADLVALVTVATPNRLESRFGAGRPIQIVGDAWSPRFLKMAIREGHRAGATV